MPVAYRCDGRLYWPMSAFFQLPNGKSWTGAALLAWPAETSRVRMKSLHIRVRGQGMPSVECHQPVTLYWDAVTGSC